MDEKDDLDWLDALAGRERGAQASDGTADRAGATDSKRDESPASWEARALRSAILSRAPAADPGVPAQDAEREADLIMKARLDGLSVDVSELAENPFARRSSWRSTLRTTARGWVAAALAIAVLTLGWHMRPIAPPEEVIRGPADGVVRLEAADPRALKQQIISELRGAGVQATGYEQLGTNGIDADLPQPLPAEVRRVLENHRIPVPKDGVLRIEIAAPEGQ
jgi:hypothetical protein